MGRTRQLVGVVTLFTLLLIALGVTGFELPLPRLGGSASQAGQLQGVRGLAATTLVRVGAGAPAGGELAFMAVEPNGNLVVTDARRASVLRFDPSGQLLSEWGPRLGNTQLSEPAGVAVANGSYYVLDRGTPRIFQLDGNGEVQKLFDLQPLSTYGLNGLAVDAAGNIYVADTGRNRILVFSPGGQLLKQVGHTGSDLGAFTQPMMLAFGPDGSMFVADWENNRVERFDSAYEATDAWPIGFHAFGIAVDPSGRVYAPDLEHRRIEVYSPRGAALGELGAGAPAALAVAPKQLALAPGGQGSLYVLGADGIQRLDLANTAPPPQSGPQTDLLSVGAIALVLVLIGLAIATRHQRRRATRLTPSDA